MRTIESNSKCHNASSLLLSEIPQHQVKLYLHSKNRKEYTGLYSDALCIHVCVFRSASRTVLLCVDCSWKLKLNNLNHSCLFCYPHDLLIFLESVRKWTSRWVITEKFMSALSVHWKRRENYSACPYLCNCIVRLMEICFHLMQGKKYVCVSLRNWSYCKSCGAS